MHRARQHGTNAGKLCGAVAFAFVVAVHAPGVLAQTAEIRLVALPSVSGLDTVTTLPTSAPRFLNDASFVVEVWAQTTHANGLSSVSADIAFTNTLASVASITHSATFNVLTAATINNTNGTIDDLSGSHLGPCSDAVAVSPNWARVAILGVSASASGSLSLQTGPTGSAIYGTAICGVGNIADAQIAFGAVSVDLVECLTDGECDDGQFCNGSETCNLTTFTCQIGTPPVCNDGFACTMDTCDPQANGGAGACVYTPNHAFCNDGQFCNGEETCVPYDPNADSFGCVTDIPPTCNDNIACTLDSCDPLANGGGGGCVYTPDHAFCDNLLFCDGAETCDAIQGCIDGVVPCTAECEHCVESTQACELCIFDLDGSGAMGTGDFSFFAPCFGACYSAGHPCLESNFDGDAGGCVGTSDFAAFVGCFGLVCGQCSGCTGPGVGVAAVGEAVAVDDLDSSTIVVRLVARSTPSTSDIRKELPPSGAAFAVGARIYLEVWASIQGNDPQLGVGLASAYVDIQFGEGRLVPLKVIPSDVLGLLAGQSISPVDGVLQAVGGCTQLDSNGVGADGNWIRVTTIVTRAVVPGATNVTVHPSDKLHGFAGVGMYRNIDPSRIDFQGVTVNVHKRIRNIRSGR